MSRLILFIAAIMLTAGGAAAAGEWSGLEGKGRDELAARRQCGAGGERPRSLLTAPTATAPLPAFRRCVH
jgi:hypothetical protein